jgi:hypothetical protein
MPAWGQPGKWMDLRVRSALCCTANVAFTAGLVRLGSTDVADAGAHSTSVVA